MLPLVNAAYAAGEAGLWRPGATATPVDGLAVPCELLVYEKRL